VKLPLSSSSLTSQQEGGRKREKKIGKKGKEKDCNASPYTFTSFINISWEGEEKKELHGRDKERT